MSSTVTVNNRTTVHKSSSGRAPSVPDVCKTPAPPGPPVPIPYPNFAFSTDTDQGSTTVKMDGKPIMLKNSTFSGSVGDEAGTLKGIASSTNKGVAKFSNYSFDVKVEGKNVPRLGDPMTSNGNGPNTLTPAELQATAAALGVSVETATLLCEAFCDAQEAYKNKKIKGRGCMSRRFQQNIEALKQQGKLGQNWLTEQPFHLPTGGLATRLTPAVFSRVAGAVAASGSLAFNFVKGIAPGIAAGGAVTTAAAVRFGRMVSVLGRGGVKIPDLMRSTTGGRQIFDAKFQWRKGKGWQKDRWSRSQTKQYKKLDKDGQKREINGAMCGCHMS